MVIRLAKASEAEQLAALHVRCWRDAYEGLLPQRYLDGLQGLDRVQFWRQMLGAQQWPRSAAWVVEHDGVRGGFAVTGPTRDEDSNPIAIAELGSIYLIRQLWGLGMGTQLLRAVSSAWRAARYEEATLWVLDRNLRARSFYERNGWMSDGAVREDTFAGIAFLEVRYRLDLAKATE